MVKVKEDLTGKVFGKLTVVEQAEDHIQSNGRRVARWKCICGCNEHNIVFVIGNSLKGGQTTSCGCVHKNKIKELGKNNKKYNRYEFYQKYGIGYCSNTNNKFYFDEEDYDKIKDYCWYESRDGKTFCSLKTHDNKTGKTLTMKDVILGQECEYINGDVFNNRKNNLRPKYTIVNDPKSVAILAGESGYTKENDNIYYVTDMGEKYKVLPCQTKYDISNVVFGKLTAICRVEPQECKTSKNASFWLCKCQCGNYCVVNRKSLVQQITKSCGCYHLEACAKKRYNNIFEVYENFCEVFDRKHEKSFKIDIPDMEKIQQYYWQVNSNGYVRTNINNKEVLLHRFLINAPDDKIVDHINRDPLDNRKSNLRLCETIENARNKSLNRKNTSGVMGVSQLKDGTWTAYIMMYGENEHLYRGLSKEDAIKARLLAEKRLYKEFAPQVHLFEKYNIKEETK